MRWRSSIIRGATFSASRSMRASRSPAGGAARAAVARLGRLAFGPAAGAAPQALKIGDPVPPFSLQTLDGKTLDIANLKGKVVLLDFWATWCVPCRQAMPELKTLLQKNSGKPLVVVSVSADQDIKAPTEFARANGMSWMQAWDGTGK